MASELKFYGIKNPSGRQCGFYTIRADGVVAIDAQGCPSGAFNINPRRPRAVKISRCSDVASEPRKRRPRSRSNK